MAETYGYTGKILRVDLSAGKIAIVPTTSYVPKFIGGRSVGAKIMWDEVPAEVSAYDPENRLVFMTGPVTGTLIPGAGRVMCMFKAPQTFPVEGYAWSGAGGFWGPELKYAGYDGIIVQGKADRPVYLWICNEHVDIIPASFLWGLNTWDTQRELRRRHGEKTRAFVIGPAGENLCRNASIQTESGNAFGEGGSGGVMGSKNLKAIAVRGTGSVKVPDPEEHMKLAEYLTSLRYVKRTKPGIKEFDYVPGGVTNSQIYDEHLMGTARYYVVHCFGCQVCSGGGSMAVEYRDAPYLSGASMCVETDVYIAPEMRYYGGKGGGRVAWYATMLTQALGLNAYEIRFYQSSEEMWTPPYPYPPDRSGGGSWMWECNVEGLFNEANTGLPWDRFGSKEFLETLVRGVAYKQGKFLKLLAEGVGRAAGYIKAHPAEFGLTEEQGSKVWAIYEKHYPRTGKFGGYPSHHTRCGCGSKEGDSRVTPQHLMCFALSQRDYATSHDPSRLWNAPRGDEQRREVGKLLFDDEKALFYLWNDDVCWSSKGKVTKYCEVQAVLRDSLIFCDWGTFYYHLYSPDKNGDFEAPSKMFNSVTGSSLTEAEIEKAAERGRTLERAISVREGRTREDDALFDYWLDGPDRLGKTVDRAEWKKAMDEYYTVMGYDLIKGWPTRAKLEELDLKDVAKELARLGKLP